MRLIITIWSILFFSEITLSQFEVDTLAFEDTTDIYLEELIEQTTEEEESQLLDAIEKTFVEKIKPWKTSIALRSRYSRKLQTARGYTNGKYLGTPLKSYQRLKVETGEKYSAGVLVEKDAGEKSINDFTNGFIQAKKIWVLESVILGDYVVEAGQGLVLWRGYDFQKGAIILAGTYKKGKDLMPHLSSDENGFLRGAAVSFNISKLKGLLFYSNKRLSASIDSSDNVSSIYTTGYFRTESEIAKRSNLVENLYGARVSYSQDNNLKFGLTGYNAEFDKNLWLLEGNKFAGKRYGVLGVDYLYEYETINIFGEFAYSSKKYLSGIGGIVISPLAQLKLLSLYRNYSYNYFSRYANPFGEKYGGANEKGFYTGIQATPLRGINISGYYDQYVFPVSSTINYPVRGSEMFLQVESRLIKNIVINFKYRQKSVDKKLKILDEFNRVVGILDMQNKNNYRCNVDYKLNRNFKIRFRFEYQTVETMINKNFEIGKMYYQELIYYNLDKLKINWRLCWFGTNSFLSGISQFENDLPGVLSIPVLYGKGVKWYCFVKYRLLNSLELSAKYSYMIREDVKKIGSGLDELPSNYDNRIGVQIDYNY